MGRPRADTSRKPKESEKDGHGYRFVSRGEMEADIRAGRYLEHGEYEGNLYGTKIDSIRAVVEAGKMCILDVNPQVGDTGHTTGWSGLPPTQDSAPSPPTQAVKVLRTAEFVPYVVFIEAPCPETLRAMNRAALESGVATKQLTVGPLPGAAAGPGAGAPICGVCGAGALSYGVCGAGVRCAVYAGQGHRCAVCAGRGPMRGVCGAGGRCAAHGGGERAHPARLRPLLRPQPDQRRPGAHVRAAARGHGAPARPAPVGARQLGLLEPRDPRPAAELGGLW